MRNGQEKEMDDIYEDDLDGLNHGPVAPVATGRPLPAVTAVTAVAAESSADDGSDVFRAAPELDPVAAE